MKHSMKFAFVTALLRTAIYDHRRSFLRRRRGDSKTNAGRSRHASRFVVQLKIHINVGSRSPYQTLNRSRDFSRCSGSTVGQIGTICRHDRNDSIVRTVHQIVQVA